MRTIERTSRFRRNYKREAKTAGSVGLESWFVPVVRLLCADLPLPESYADPPLMGVWKDYRDCRIKPDLVLIYHKPDNTTLRLVRLGSPSELGL